MYNFDWMCKFLVQISRALHVKFANAFEILDWYQNTNCQLCQDKFKIKAELKNTNEFFLHMKLDIFKIQLSFNPCNYF